ncbi:MAG: tetrathionate reductase family octaheme c-type cytochrome [Thermoanaerobaculaceae bacterium]|nr:tetrathionate reductase family octaheme c-type cytochrome [Thermoanaerobaculaceae bacterium]
MRNIFIILTFLAIFLIAGIALLKNKEVEKPLLLQLKEKYAPKPEKKKVEHAKFENLNKKFKEPQEVTKECESCHNLTADEIMKSNHYNWEREEYMKRRGVIYLGKKNAVNNYCIASHGNEKSCAKCHVGLGLDKDGNIFTDPANIDCMVCHDNTETYMKAPEKGGEPVKTLDFEKIAQNVGKPKRSNCGVCHFYGGGGNNVKHGDLEMAQFSPTKDVDVHMGVDSVNMQCVDCHKTKEHNISGKLYSLSSMNRDRATCEECHTSTPHEEELINEHTLKVSCQACHIPIYAKVNSTKLYWDWSTAGKLKNGEPYVEEDEDGNHKYMSIKGSFVWGKNLKPDYVWFNGTASHYLAGDKVENPSEQLVLNPLYGSYNDEDSKIIPVKIHIAKQPFDPVNKIVIMPKLYDPEKGVGAFWKDFDWVKASEVGMKEQGLPFSGKVDFIETKMYWPVNHMVSTKENSVQCAECHTRKGSRIANLTDFYIPGRDFSKIVDRGGLLMIIFAFLGVFAHGGGRIYAHYYRARRGK